MKTSPPRAFPSNAIGEEYGGMSLHDWFAGQAVAEAMRYALSHDDDPMLRNLLPEEWAARIAYGVADAMMTERKALIMEEEGTSDHG